MKSVEFLVALFLLAWLFSFLYLDARSYVQETSRKLAGLNESLKLRAARSLVSSLVAYGFPFELSSFPNVFPSQLGVEYDPATGTYSYETYSRW